MLDLLMKDAIIRGVIDMILSAVFIIILTATIIVEHRKKRK